MANVLVLTTDLPYFPGRNGHDHFNLRHLARTHRVAVIGPRHAHYPEEGMANLEKFVANPGFWPAPVAKSPLFKDSDIVLVFPRVLGVLPKFLLRALSERLTGLHKGPGNSYWILATLSNCAPHLLRVLHDADWQVAVVIQTSASSWLDYLPSHMAKMIYFHDVRTEYLPRAVDIDGRPTHGASKIAKIRRQEQRCLDMSDVAGFVSALDEKRARQIFDPAIATGVAPIPVDTGYFTPRPDSSPKPTGKVILFTGHLSHPPNVDAVEYFVRDIWPEIRKKHPDAVFRAVGMLPHPRVEKVMAAATGVELHRNVPDIRPYFWDSRVYVIPMRYGGGVRQKIFEAWAMKLPVVSTTMGVEGTTAESGKNCSLADTPADFAEAVSALLTDDPTCDRLAVNAADDVRAHNSIPAAAGQFRDLVERTVHIRKDRPFKVLADLRWMEIGKAGGTEQMTRELFQALGHLDFRNEYRFFCPRSSACEFDFSPSFRHRFFYSDRKERLKSDAKWHFANSVAKAAGMHPVHTPEMISLRNYREMDFEIVHSLCGYIQPDMEAFPNVLTVLDLQHVHMPEFFSPEDWKMRDELYRRSIGRAKHLVCISDNTRNDIHRTYGVPMDKMSTVWIIPSRHAWERLESDRCVRILEKLGISGRFAFFPAHCWPHKNHRRLVEAFARILPEIPKDFRLYFTGGSFPADHPAKRFIEENGLADRIVHLGYRSPMEMKAIMQTASLMVFPSLFEGFGMPVAEAIVAGCPVVCSNTTSIPEIAGSAARYFDPLNVDSIAAAMLEIIRDPAAHDFLAEESLRRRLLFRSREIAAKMVGIYKRVHTEHFS